MFNIILHVTEASFYIQTMNPSRVLHPKAPQMISLRVLTDKATQALSSEAISGSRQHCFRQ